jgi:hypothetical protein
LKDGHVSPSERETKCATHRHGGQKQFVFHSEVSGHPQKDLRYLFKRGFDPFSVRRNPQRCSREPVGLDLARSKD